MLLVRGRYRFFCVEFFVENSDHLVGQKRNLCVITSDMIII